MKKITDFLNWYMGKVHERVIHYNDLLMYGIVGVLFLNPTMGSFWLILTLGQAYSNVQSVGLAWLNFMMVTIVFLNGAVSNHTPTFVAFGASMVIAFLTFLVHYTKLIWYTSIPMAVISMLFVSVLFVLGLYGRFYFLPTSMWRKGERKAEPIDGIIDPENIS